MTDMNNEKTMVLPEKVSKNGVIDANLLAAALSTVATELTSLEAAEEATGGAAPKFRLLRNLIGSIAAVTTSGVAAVDTKSKIIIKKPETNQSSVDAITAHAASNSMSLSTVQVANEAVANNPATSADTSDSITTPDLGLATVNAAITAADIVENAAVISTIAPTTSDSITTPDLGLATVNAAITAADIEENALVISTIAPTITSSATTGIDGNLKISTNTIEDNINEWKTELDNESKVYDDLSTQINEIREMLENIENAQIGIEKMMASIVAKQKNSK